MGASRTQPDEDGSYAGAAGGGGGQGEKASTFRTSNERGIRVSVEAFRGSAEQETPKGEGVEPGAHMLEKRGGQSSLLHAIPEEARVGVDFRGVSGWVPATFQMPGMGGALRRRVRSAVAGGKGGGASATAKRQILYNICGSVSPGEVLALMGPSGSGKTSFISVLGGRKPKLMDAEGDILFNGKPLDKAMKRRVGFVLQDDLMYASLTVEETLYFAAMLRLPKTMTRFEKKERVESVISTLGLTKCRDTLIGGFMMRGVSGGERKRVSVGHELLIDPAFLLLDEPTSGLDATTAMNLLTTLRLLAQGGRTVLTTIHQPSSRIYRQLDNVLLLSEGHTMYYGSGKLAIEWFGKLHYRCPYGVNIADYILDLANGDMLADGSRDDEAREGLIARYRYFGDSHPNGLQSESELEGADLPTSVKSLDEDAAVLQVKVTDGRNVEPLEEADSPVKKSDRWGASYGGQIAILFQRCVKVRRTDALGLQNYLRLLLVAAIAGILWWQVGGDDTLLAASDVIGLLFFEMLFMSFYAMFRALFTFPNDFNMMLKERRSGMYRLSTFYIARTLSDLPMDCTIPTLFVIIVYWSTGLRVTAGAFFANWLSIMLVTLVGQSLGMLIGAAVMDVQQAQTITSVLMLGLMLVGGFYVRDVPDWVGWLKYGSFMWWGFSLLNKIEFGDRSFVDCGGLGEATDGPVQCVPVDSLKEALNLPTDVNDSVWPEVTFLLSLLVVTRAVIYYVLQRKTRS
eukprot:evm.model.scf_157.4 EVM.evm.TU.scf_157.4   scf_157:83416-93168(-)